MFYKKNILSVLISLNICVATCHDTNSSFIPDDYECLNCQLKPITRPWRHVHRENKNKWRTHPCIPFGRGVQDDITTVNWAGYAAYLPKNPQKSVVMVKGSWIVPAMAPSASSKNISYCSCWVGIDGFNSDSVEQVGTAHGYVKGALEQYAWTEMFPDYAVEIIGFPVNAGDHVSAHVAFVGNDKKGNEIFVLSIVNHTRKKGYEVRKYGRGLLRSCAEWIVEAPYLNGNLPLAHFSPVRFFDCACMIDNVTGPINNDHWHNAMITMVTENNQQKSVTSKLSNNAQFSVEWQRE